jgi:hypothetical protein
LNSGESLCLFVTGFVLSRDTLLIGRITRGLDARGGGIDEILVGARTLVAHERAQGGDETRGQSGGLSTKPSVASPRTPWR